MHLKEHDKGDGDSFSTPDKKSPALKTSRLYQYQRTATPRIPRFKEFQPKSIPSKISQQKQSSFVKTKLTEIPTYEEESSVVETGSEKAQEEPDLCAIQDGLNSFADSGFGFNCLKDLVNFQEESLWSVEDKEDNEESNKKGVDISNDNNSNCTRSNDGKVN
jgi:hypothetical protein